MANGPTARRRWTGIRTAAAAAFLTLPLWLASCVGAGPAAEQPPPSGQLGATAPAAPPLTVPAPRPQAPPPDTSLPQSGTFGEETPNSGLTSPPGTPASPPLTSSAEPPDAAGPEATPTPSTATRSPGGPAPTAPASARPGPTATLQTVTAYFVMLDDGGSNGVRFGCNDSLVGLARTVPGNDGELPAAVRALLEAPAGVARPDDVYNALDGSDLTYLAGSFDGTTVTVYLSGTLRPGGVCDLPRVEAQLTQTAVTAAGAIRADVYVNGLPLAEALRPG